MSIRIVSTRAGRIISVRADAPLTVTREDLQGGVRQWCARNVHHTIASIAGHMYHVERRKTWWGRWLWIVQPAHHLQESLVCQAFESHSWPVCTTDPSGTIVAANAALCHWTGWSLDQLIGRAFADVVVDVQPGLDNGGSADGIFSKMYGLKAASGYEQCVRIGAMVPYEQRLIFILRPQDGDEQGDEGRALDSIGVPAALLDENGGLCHVNAAFGGYWHGSDAGAPAVQGNWGFCDVGQKYAGDGPESNGQHVEDNEATSCDLLESRHLETGRKGASDVGSLRMQGGSQTGRRAMPLMQWIHPHDRYSFAQHLQRLRKVQAGKMGEGDAGMATPIRVRLRQGGDHTFLAFVRYSQKHRLRAPGRFFAVFIMQQSIHPMKEADPQKMQLMGQLASGIVHDFNNLLTGILGFCDLLLQRHHSDEPSYKDVAQIKHSALGAARLIQQLLAFSKSAPPLRDRICLRDCVRDLLPLMHRMVGPKIVVTLKQATPVESALLTHGDRSQIDQILLNLAINARDAMAEGGELHFSIKQVHLKSSLPVMRGVLPAQTYVVVRIQDTGTGIDPAHVDRIFDPFFSTKMAGQGTGLGLSNVLQMMQQFQGGITVDTRVGRGTTFALYFPEYVGQASAAGAAREDAVAHTSDMSVSIPDPMGGEVHSSQRSAVRSAVLSDEIGMPAGAVNEAANMPHLCPPEKRAGIQESSLSDAGAPPAGHLSAAAGVGVGVRVLLVEDEDPVRLFAARSLRTKGYEVVEARDGTQALQHMRAPHLIPFDVVVTDVMMPGIDGPALATRMQDQWPHIKILFVSGYPEEEVRSHLPAHMQTVYFLPKPFVLDDLVRKIQSIVASPPAAPALAPGATLASF